jgi:hypothetical protein
MATKKKSRSKKAPKIKKVVYKDISEQEHIELCIKFSERCIDNSGNSIDEFFKGQVARQRQKLADLKTKKA